MNTYPDKITKLKGRYIALTGRAWIARAALVERIRRRGGIPTPSGHVNGFTNILVRGESENWLKPGFGTKEAELARLIESGGNAVLVHDFEFRRLLEEGKAARTTNVIAGRRAEWLLAHANGTNERPTLTGALDKPHTATGRREQALLRRFLLDSETTGVCSLCGNRYPDNLLVAAHKKPRSFCTAKEKRDLGNVAFLLCLLGCDALYELGYVSVHVGGRVIVARGRHLSPHLRRHVTGLRNRTCSEWTQESDAYFDWHRKRRFQS